MTLRWRLSLALVLAVLAGAVAFGLVARAIVQRELSGDVDRDLRAQVERLVGDLDHDDEEHDDDERGGPLRRPGIRPGDFFGRGALIAQVTGSDGRVLLRTSPVDAIGGLPQPDFEELDDDELHLRTVRIGTEQYRIAEAEVRDGSVVQVARPLSELSRFLDQLLQVLVAAGAFAAGAALLLGPWAARATLRPVGRMTRTAREIARSPRDLSTRVEPAFPDPELREFADSMNEMLDAIEQADRQQRRFVADASHELRTPLTSLGGNATWLAGRPDLGDDERDAIGSVGRDVERLVRIADGLTVLARLDSVPTLQLEPVDVAAAIHESVVRARRAHPDHDFEVGALDADVVPLDSELLRRILDNLLDNAGRYTPTGTSVRVSAAAAGTDGLRIEVTDDGPGIPSDERDLVLQRFRRGSTSTGRSGTGLGLAIVDEAARTLGGSLTLADGDDGTGLRCVVELRLRHAVDG